MRIAFLYAGQGSQHVGMGRDLYEAYPAFRQVLDNAPVDFDLKKLSFEGPEEQLGDTRYTQPCMVAFAAGVTALLREAGITPDYTAGLSLGEYSALHCAGVFEAQTAISLVAFRGQAMAQAVQGRACGMAAVLGLDRETLKKACEEASELGVVECTNFNCPGQIVISGDEAAVDKAGELAKAAGAKRVLPLKVSGPFHTSLMAPAGDALRERFQTVDFHEMQVPVLFNCLGDLKGENDTIPNLLERQVQSSVYLEDTIRRLKELEVDTVVEIGPGRALSGFVRKTAKEIKCYPVETAQELEAAIAALKGA